MIPRACFRVSKRSIPAVGGEMRSNPVWCNLDQSCPFDHSPVEKVTLGRFILQDWRSLLCYWLTDTIPEHTTCALFKCDRVTKSAIALKSGLILAIKLWLGSRWWKFWLLCQRLETGVSGWHSQAGTWERGINLQVGFHCLNWIYKARGDLAESFIYPQKV